jgi:two-component system chemotaxis sensor kinase CheA
VKNSRSALQEQFRGILGQRAQRLTELLEPGCISHKEDAPRRALLGELHTLKGEAKMLGWSALATLAHALEEHLGIASPDHEQAAAVIDAILLSLVEGTSQTEADELWRTSYEALTGEALPGPVEKTSSQGSSTAHSDGTANDARESERWIQVEEGKVEALGEALALLSADFSRFSLLCCERSASIGRLEQQELESEGERLRASLSDILELSLSLRLTPVDPMFARLAAHARNLAQQRGKQLTVVTESEGVRVERAVIDRLAEPLMHLVSNAVDHGIEHPHAQADGAPATIELRAKMQGALVKLQVKDNGRGIDRNAVFKKALKEGRLPPDASPTEALNVLFQSGFSMKETADEVSRRGVGPAVVKRSADSMGVTISLDSDLGQGTTFTLGVPAALTRQNLFVMRVGTTLCGIPGRLVQSVAGASNLDAHARTYRYDEDTLPLRSLAGTLDLPLESEERFVVIMTVGTKRIAMRCEEIVGHLDLVRRPVASTLNRRTGVCASALTERAELVLVLDPERLCDDLLHSSSARPGNGRSPTPERRRILIVDDSVVVRNLLQDVFRSAGYDVTTAEHGRMALEQIDSIKPGVVLSDIEMPVMGGFELLRSIREKHELLPVVLVSARSSPEDRNKAADLGANAYITKGEFESESLVSVVERLYREQ